MKVQEFIKKHKVLFALIFVIMVIVLIIANKIYKKHQETSALKKEIELYFSQEHILKDVKVVLLEERQRGASSYYAEVSCSNLGDFSYEEIMELPFYYEIKSLEYVDVVFVCNGDIYNLETANKLTKNGKVVYEKEVITRSRSCERCSKEGKYSYMSPFSGQKEWYCAKHYNELQDLLGQFGM